MVSSVSSATALSLSFISVLQPLRRANLAMNSFRSGRESTLSGDVNLMRRGLVNSR